MRVGLALSTRDVVDCRWDGGAATSVTHLAGGPVSPEDWAYVPPDRGDGKGTQFQVEGKVRPEPGY